LISAILPYHEVNNAAAFWFGNLEAVKRENWLRLYETNVVGYADAIKESLPDFRKKGKGVVVNIASVSSCIYIVAFCSYDFQLLLNQTCLCTMQSKVGSLNSQGVSHSILQRLVPSHVASTISISFFVGLF
jgi:hypothetical protein